jgi:hypothetical protein
MSSEGSAPAAVLSRRVEVAGIETHLLEQALRFSTLPVSAKRIASSAGSWSGLATERESRRSEESKPIS